MNMKKDQPYTSRLKGVAALLGEETYSSYLPEINNSVPSSVPLTQIKLPSSQPRRYFDPDKLEELSRSIKQFGILEPLLIRPLADGGYELVAGERRLKAAQLALLTEVPVVIRDMDDDITRQVRLVENLQREDLNPIEETEGILELLVLRLEISTSETIKLLQKMDNEAKGKITLNVTGSPQALIIEGLFDALGTMKWDSFVRNRLPLLNLPPDVLDILRQGKIEYTKARAVATVKDAEQRASILDAAITQDLSLSEIKELITSIRPKEKGSAKESQKSEYKELSKQLSTSKIWDDPKKKKQIEKLLSQIKSLLDEGTAI
jgi:ParB family transcriptional regulator, chromosome partitioning protein